ncbi:hypothetical protein SUGI_1153180 [Cryptomeria japonica]|nr:hypothetical protein SUGI_1153180 [Cryptomeria japonica]
MLDLAQRAQERFREWTLRCSAEQSCSRGWSIKDAEFMEVCKESGELCTAPSDSSRRTSGVGEDGARMRSFRKSSKFDAESGEFCSAPSDPSME